MITCHCALKCLLGGGKSIPVVLFTVALHWNAAQMEMFKVNERAEIKAVGLLKRNISTVLKKP